MPKVRTRTKERRARAESMMVQRLAPCEPCWSVAECARALGVCTVQVKRWIDEGMFAQVIMLPGTSARKIPDSAFQKFVKRHSVFYRQRRTLDEVNLFPELNENECGENENAENAPKNDFEEPAYTPLWADGKKRHGGGKAQACGENENGNGAFDLYGELGGAK